MAKMFQIRPVIIFLLTDIVEDVTLEIALKKAYLKRLPGNRKDVRFFIKNNKIMRIIDQKYAKNYLIQYDIFVK